MIDAHLIREGLERAPQPSFAPRSVPLPPIDAAWSARTLPLLRASELILAHDAEHLSLVLAAARAVKPSISRDLASAFDAGGDHLIELADHLAEAARRLRVVEVAAEHAARESARGPSPHPPVAKPEA